MIAVPCLSLFFLLLLAAAASAGLEFLRTLDRGDYKAILIGCYKDKNGKLMRELIADDNTDNSPTNCADLCHAAGYAFAGVIKGDRCYCSNNSVSDHWKLMTAAVPMSDCDKRKKECWGSSGIACGTNTRMLVYYIY